MRARATATLAAASRWSGARVNGMRNVFGFFPYERIGLDAGHRCLGRELEGSPDLLQIPKALEIVFLL